MAGSGSGAGTGVAAVDTGGLHRKDYMALDHKGRIPVGAHRDCSPGA